MARIKGETSMSVLLFVVALFCGFVAGRVSDKNETPKTTDSEQKLREELAVAKNLNDSLFTDLQEAKETIWKLKNASKNK